MASASHFQTEEQQSEEQWQYARSDSGNVNRGGHYNGSGNRNFNRSGDGAPNSHNQQHWRGPRSFSCQHLHDVECMFYSGGGGNHYEGGQRPCHENSNRDQRGGPNPN